MTAPKKSRKWHPARREAFARVSVDKRTMLTEANETIAMQARQLAEARAIIRRLTIL